MQGFTKGWDTSLIMFMFQFPKSIVQFIVTCRARDFNVMLALPLNNDLSSGCNTFGVSPLCASIVHHGHNSMNPKECFTECDIKGLRSLLPSCMCARESSGIRNSVCVEKISSTTVSWLLISKFEFLFCTWKQMSIALGGVGVFRFQRYWYVLMLSCEEIYDSNVQRIKCIV